MHRRQKQKRQIKVRVKVNCLRAAFIDALDYMTDLRSTDALTNVFKEENER